MTKFQWEIISWFMRIVIQHIVFANGTHDWIGEEAKKWDMRLAEDDK
jgi:hypothetical protein